MTTRRYTEHVETIRAASEEGEEFDILVFQTIIEFTALSGEVSRRGGSRGFSLPDGSAVNRDVKDHDLFTVVETGEILRKV